MSKVKHSYKRILEISDDHKQITLPDSRYYRRNSDYYPSVTYVLGTYPKGKHFEDWLKKVGYASEYIVKKAAEDGQRDLSFSKENLFIRFHIFLVDNRPRVQTIVCSVVTID